MAKSKRAVKRPQHRIVLHKSEITVRDTATGERDRIPAWRAYCSCGWVGTETTTEGLANHNAGQHLNTIDP